MPSLYVSTLDVNKTMKPFDDPKVVEALHFAVDRQALVDTGEFGLGEVAYQPFPDGYVGYNPELDGIYAYDPDKAASILKEAGYTKPIPLTISTSNPEGVPELLQAQLSKVGFEPTIETIPQAQFTQQVYINHEKALAVDFFAGRESPAQAFQVLFSDTGLMNPGREYDPAVKEAIEKVIATPLDDPAYADALAGGDQGRGHLDAQHLPLQPAARGGPGQGRLRAARAPHVGDLGRRHGLVSAAISVSAPPRGPGHGRRGGRLLQSVRPFGRLLVITATVFVLSTILTFALGPCRERTRRPPCSARRRRPRTSRG